MPVTIASTLFDLLPPPDYGSYKKVRNAPKITFQAKAGYKHQREAYTQAKYQFEVGWNSLTTAQHNTLVSWLDFAGSNAFYYVVPDAEYFEGITSDVRLVRMIDETVELVPRFDNIYRARITLEDL